MKEYNEKLQKDKRRWDNADTNKDNHLSLQEYGAFLHPHEFKHMHDLVAVEEIEKMDKDRDGLFSLSEFIGEYMKAICT